jgi:Protein of unknown function (DUF3830)
VLRVQFDIVLRFLDEDVAATARLLREQAPEKCSAVWDALPVSVLARHGIYSGHATNRLSRSLALSPSPRARPGDDRAFMFRGRRHPCEAAAPKPVKWTLESTGPGR